MARNFTVTRWLGLLLISTALITLTTARPFSGQLTATTKGNPTSRNASEPRVEYRALLESFYDAVFNLPNLTEAREFIVSEYINHNPINPKSASGIEGLKYTSKVFRTGFPDLNITLEDLIVGGDRLVARIRVRGTHQGEFMGLKPTGKQIDIAGFEIYGIAGEKISERWGNLDGIALLQQLGVIRTQEAPDDNLSEGREEPPQEGQRGDIVGSRNLTDLNDWEKLKTAFLREIGRVRIVALVSPN